MPPAEAHLCKFARALPDALRDARLFAPCRPHPHMGHGDSHTYLAHAHCRTPPPHVHFHGTANHVGPHLPRNKTRQ